MKEIRIEKVTLNIGVGEPGDRLEKAKKLLELITGETAVFTQSMKRIPTWGLRPKLKIATKVTLRGQKALDVLKRLLQASDNELLEKKFDDFGNFSFGVAEYIDIPGVEYDVSIGIIGLDVAVTLERPGFRVKKRLRSAKIPKRHKISKEEAIQFIKDKFGVKVGEEE